MQQQIFDAYLNGDNIFMTGPGGTGKTYTIKNIYKHAKENNRKICVTALTGVAAVLLDCNAMTLHSWAGIGLANKSDMMIINKIYKSKYYRHNWENTDILIIDEVSMMSAQLFDLLNKIGQIIRKNNRPFGGIQIIFSGDFFQLPPVKENIFCFESVNFDKCFSHKFKNIFVLTKIYRQNDAKFKKILLNLRMGLISKSTIELLNSKVIKDNKELIKKLEGENITRLVPTKSKANAINEFFIGKLKEKKYIYKRKFKENTENMSEMERIKFDLMTDAEKETEYNLIRQNTMTEEIATLKKGAYVMCVANLNMEMGVANGSTGIVVDFTKEKYPVVQFEKCKMTVGMKEYKSDNIPGISSYQIPLILAWGITIHKAQGLTLERAILDIGKDIFECGQMYVALSRLKSLEGLYLEEFSLENLKININVLNFYK